MASLVLAGIAGSDANVQAVRAASIYRNNRGADIKVAIPATGRFPLGEFDRWLRRTLGRETTIAGGVYRTADGLTVTVRAGDNPVVSANGGGG